MLKWHRPKCCKSLEMGILWREGCPLILVFLCHTWLKINGIKRDREGDSGREGMHLNTNFFCFIPFYFFIFAIFVYSTHCWQGMRERERDRERDREIQRERETDRDYFNSSFFCSILFMVHFCFIYLFSSLLARSNPISF